MVAIFCVGTAGLFSKFCGMLLPAAVSASGAFEFEAGWGAAVAGVGMFDVVGTVPTG
jgi:hypothetical protein